jgi:hypothetical protein
LSDLFGLHEPLLADFSCALLDKIRYVGRLYVFPAHVAFSSSVFGDTKLVLPLVEVRALNRKKSVLVVPDAIELVCGEPSLPLDQCETFVFASFFNRELAFTTLERAWRAATAPAPAPSSPTPTPTPTPIEVPPTNDEAVTSTTAMLESSAPVPIPAVPAAAAAVDDSTTRLRNSPLSHSASKRTRRPATMPSVLPSLMPENDDDALPFISVGCPHVANSSVDEVFTSESATGSTTIQQDLPNCSLAIVWHQLFKTTAFWRHVHAKNGFLDFEGSPWRARTASDSSSSNNNNNSTGGTAVAAGGDNSSGGGDATEYKPATCCVERLITFKVALSQPVGPKSTRMTQTLVARFVTARRLVIETVSQCHDAPYADSFLVNSMLVVDEKHDGSCHLRIWWGVRFLRTVWMVKGLIESTALRDNQQFYGLWALEALTALHERRIATLGESDEHAVEATPRVVEPAPKEPEEREVVQQIQQIVVGDNPPMLARSVVMSLSGVILLWLAWWGVSALSASGAPPADDPVRQLREQVTRLEARIDSLSAALTRIAHLLPDERRDQVRTVLSTLESSEQTQAVSSGFGARMLIHRAAQLSGSAEDARTLALLSDALEQLSRTPPSDNTWSSTAMSFVTIVVAILVSVAIACVARH